MFAKEATARIKINKLLETAGWRFFPEGSAPANIRLEPSVTIKSSDLEALGENFEKTSKGFIDFLLLNAKGFRLIVLEAKSEDKNPLVGKEHVDDDYTVLTQRPNYQSEAAWRSEAEQALVAANRELIARFEKKIQATLSRVWGETS